MITTMKDAWEVTLACRRPKLEGAILGCIELSCSSLAPHPGARLVEWRSGLDGLL